MTPALLPGLLEAVLRTFGAAAAVWLGLRLLRVRNLLAQKAAWGIVLAAALAMPALMRWQWLPAWAAVELPTPSWAAHMDTATATTPTPAPSTMDIPAPAREASTNEIEDTLPASAVPIAQSQVPLNSGWESVPAPVLPRPAKHPARMSAMDRILAVGWALYLAVCGILLLRLLWGLSSSLWLWMRAERIETPADLDFPASIRVCSSSRVASPFNIGSGILLPANYVEWDREKLRVVLAHERSHIRQRDFYLQLIAGLYAAVTWFSPLGWWLKRKLSELGEAISDRAGVDAAASPSAYAGLLLEFAALPRPATNGVAMAHSRNLSRRIEHLLNEASFRLAFAGGRRAFLSLSVLIALIAAAAMIRVQAVAAARQVDSQQPATLSQNQQASQPAATGQSNPEPVQATGSEPAQTPAEPPTPAAAPSPVPEASPVPPAPRAPDVDAQGPFPAAPAMPPMPPMPRIHVEVPEIAMTFAEAGRGPCFGDGDSYAIVSDSGSKTRFCGNWNDIGTNDVDKARSQAHGSFVLFRHEGKLYVIDDPAIISQIESMDKSMDDLKEQMRALGKQMRDQGQQARDAARKARENATNIPTPDLSKEIAALDATAASLKANQGGTVSRDQLRELQREIAAIQGRVMQAQVSVDMKEFNSDMAKFGEEQGKLGQQMGKLGAQMGQEARENNEKVRSTIDESLKNGKARPVN
jgi:beta-lactamase regulating signal transducer with metallopeptidase domain